MAVRLRSDSGGVGRREHLRPVPVEQPVGPLRLFPAGQLQLLEPGHGRLEARVVVQRHLVVDVLFAQVPVVVVLVRPADQGAVQDLRVGLRAAVRLPVARRRSVRTRAVDDTKTIKLLLLSSIVDANVVVVPVEPPTDRSLGSNSESRRRGGRSVACFRE